MSQRGLKKKALILFGYSNAFCGLSSPRHHMEEHLMVLFQFNTKLYLTPWRLLFDQTPTYLLAVDAVGYNGTAGE
jgi:hypothetical protein